MSLSTVDESCIKIGSAWLAHTFRPAPGQVDLDENDQNLLEYFAEFVLPFVFPIVEKVDIESIRPDPNVLQALENNKRYLQAYSSNSAQRYQRTLSVKGSQTVNEILRHRCAVMSILGIKNCQQILEKERAMVFSQILSSQVNDHLKFQHLDVVMHLVHTLEFPRLLTDLHDQNRSTTFSMTLTAWVDILSATINGTAPIFATIYGQNYLSSSDCSLGLRQLMGCEDKVMYLISEIACLKAKCGGMDDIQRCLQVQYLGNQIGLTEVNKTEPEAPYYSNGALNTDQLIKNITNTFRLAARIYLCSLVPGFFPAQASCIDLVSKLASALEYIPSGPEGFDETVSWVYLVGGSFSTLESRFRTLFINRSIELGPLANTGSFGRVLCFLYETWAAPDGL